MEFVINNTSLWHSNNSSVYFQIAGITLEVRADFPLKRESFNPILQNFMAINGERVDILLCHHFSFPDLVVDCSWEQIYHKPPWAIYKTDNGWTYLGIAPKPDDPALHRVVFFNHDHTFGHIYNPDAELFRQGNLQTLSLFPTDQIWLARVLADRQGCYFHAAGMILDGQGFLFVGHSEAGKSTLVTMLQDDGEILCDDRIIVRRWPEGFKIHGTWSHGDVPIVSPNSAPLRAIFLLEQAPHNKLIPVTDRREIVRTLPFFIVKPLVTADWWEKTLDLVGQIAREVPVYRLQFDKSGGVRQVLKELS